MKLTKQFILNRINRLQTNYRVVWDEVVYDLDLGIEKINDWMGTRYPPISEILDDFASPEKTYSYRASGNDVPFFPEKYFLNIVIPYAVMQLLAYDEEFSAIYSKYKEDVEENLLYMVANELVHVPLHLIDAPKGVYFSNPNPDFKENPEDYFNRTILPNVPRIKVRYEWNVPSKYSGVGFVDKPLPVDNNSYEINHIYMPSSLGANNYIPHLVDEKGHVIGVFLGWSLDKVNINTSTITLKEDVIFYGMWNFDIISFKYEGDGGSLMNWQPKYINKYNSEDIKPVSGTAHRTGYRFIGFNPITFNASNTIEPEHNFLEDWELSQDELDFINSIEEEPEFTFTARWEKIDYVITFQIDEEQWIVNNDTTYRYGDLIKLDPPKPIDKTDEYLFFGWYDNPNFLGNAVTHIQESDYGDKNFWAKTDEQFYTLKILNTETQESIYESREKKGKDLNTILEKIEVVNEREIEENGLSFMMTFKGYKIFGTNQNAPSKITQDLLLIQHYDKNEIMIEVELIYYKDKNTTETKTIKIQKGTIIKLQLLLNEIFKESSYEDDDGTWLVSGFSEEEINGAETNLNFRLTVKETLYATYSKNNINVIFRDVASITDELVHDFDETSDEEFLVSSGSDYNLISNYIFETLRYEVKSVLTTESELSTRFQKFMILENDSFKELTTLIKDSGPEEKETVYVVPYYTTDFDKNEKYNLIINLMYNTGSTKTTIFTKRFSYEPNAKINLNTLILENEKNNFNSKEFSLEDEKKVYSDSVLANEIVNTSDFLINEKNKNIYLEVVSNKKIELNYDGLIKSIYLNDLEVIDGTPYLNINETIFDFNVIVNLGYYLAGFKIDGVEFLFDQSIELQESILEQGANVSIYTVEPYLVRNKNFKINFKQVFDNGFETQETLPQGFLTPSIPDSSIIATNELKHFIFNSYTKRYFEEKTKDQSGANEELITDKYIYKGNEYTDFPVRILLPKSDKDNITNLEVRIVYKLPAFMIGIKILPSQNYYFKPPYNSLPILYLKWNVTEYNKSYVLNYIKNMLDAEYTSSQYDLVIGHRDAQNFTEETGTTLSGGKIYDINIKRKDYS